MTDEEIAELAVLGALAAARASLEIDRVARIVDEAGVVKAVARRAMEALAARGFVTATKRELSLTSAGARHFLERHAAIEAAFDPSPRYAQQEDCPSIPWLTTVQTKWIDAVSLNFAVDPAALARLLPPPIEPEIHQGTAWVQLLMSSLRDMRPQGLGSIFGVSFYQASYRAAVRYPGPDGSWRRAGYFVRSETNHPVMRVVGNALVEFKFHDFGAADMVMLRDGDRLTLGIDPAPSDEAGHDGGKLVAIIDTRPRDAPPSGSVWSSLEEIEHPLVDCYDALGVDRDGGWLYVLTIDRDPWNARFVEPVSLYSEYFETGALGGGVARFDSALHLRECAYRWRPLRREPLPAPHPRP